MFHVEHGGRLQFRGISLLFLLALGLLACEKPNPHPETLDPLYAELVHRAEELKKSSEAARADLEKAKEEMRAIRPQTGQIQYGRKRLHEAEEKFRITEQLQRYYEVKAENRLENDQITYQKAYLAKKPWPNPGELEEFLETERAQAPKKAWDVSARFAAAKMKMRVVPRLDDKKTEGKKPEGEKPASHE